MDDTRTLHIQPPWWMPVTVLLAVLIGGGFYLHGKKAEGIDRMPAMINVTGEGKASATPDIAELSFGLSVQRQPTAKQAMDQLGKTMQKILDAVKAAGIPEKDINTEGLSLSPAYDWNDGRQIMRGFDASQSLRVKVRDLDKVSDILAAATNAGANQAGGVNFTVDDPEKARAEAREKAIEQAQEKAQMLADQLGMKLGKLKSFNESGSGPIPPMPYGRGGGIAMDMMESAVTATPLPAGDQEILVQVMMTYELK